MQAITHNMRKRSIEPALQAANWAWLVCSCNAHPRTWEIYREAWRRTLEQQAQATREAQWEWNPSFN